MERVAATAQSRSRAYRWITQVVAAVALIGSLHTTTAAAAKVYQWTDEDGNVHFGQTPPPDSQARPAAGGDGAASSKTGQDGKLNDTDWYLISGNRMFRLDFGMYNQSERFRLYEVAPSASDLKGSYIDGQWRFKGAELQLRFEQEWSRRSHTGQASPLPTVTGRTVRYRAVDTDPGRMRLNGTPPELAGEWMARETRSVSSERERAILGSWHFQGTDAFITFRSQGTFSANAFVGPPIDRELDTEGTWRYYDPVLRLNHLAVRRILSNMAGEPRRARFELGYCLTSQSWRIEELSPNTMKLVQPTSGRSYRLVKH